MRLTLTSQPCLFGLVFRFLFIYLCLESGRVFQVLKKKRLFEKERYLRSTLVNFSSILYGANIS